jgi:hypothetical protein
MVARRVTKASGSMFKIEYPGRFLAAAIFSAVIFGSIVYPSLNSHPELIAIPIICGAAICTLTEILSSKSQVAHPALKIGEFVESQEGTFGVHDISGTVYGIKVKGVLGSALKKSDYPFLSTEKIEEE